MCQNDFSACLRLGLAPGTNYTYRIKSGGKGAAWSDSFTFRTPVADGGVSNREKEIGGSRGSLEPLGLFLRTAIPFIWRVLSAFLPA